MKSSEVPDDLIVLVSDLLEEEAHEHCDSEPCPGSTVAYHNSLARHLLSKLLPEHERQVRVTIAASLRRAADGRREYAQSATEDSEIHERLTRSATYYESTAQIIEDPRTILGVIPSWRWTDEETASLYPERGGA